MIGRDPAEIVRSVQLLVDMGDPDATRERVLGFIDAGARHLVLAPMPPWPASPVRRLAADVVEPVLARLSAG